MKSVLFLLADAASVREGLLSALGLGINIVHRPDYPAQLGLPLVAIFELDPEGEVAHTVNIEILDDSETRLFDLRMESGEVGAPVEVANLAAYFPTVLPSQAMLLPKPGRYRAQMKIDDVVSSRFEFEAKVSVAESGVGLQG
jgi:hypothetical protein